MQTLGPTQVHTIISLFTDDDDDDDDDDDYDDDDDDDVFNATSLCTCTTATSLSMQFIHSPSGHPSNTTEVYKQTGVFLFIHTKTV